MSERVILRFSDVPHQVQESILLATAPSSETRSADTSRPVDFGVQSGGEDGSSRSLRHAFIAADALVCRVLQIHFGKGGRREEFAGVAGTGANPPTVASPTTTTEDSKSDTKDIFEELLFWRRRLECIIDDVMRVDVVLGRIMFCESWRWVEDMLVGVGTVNER